MVWTVVHSQNTIQTNVLFCFLSCFVLILYQRVGLEFYIDVHAHSTMLNGFMYGNVFEDEERVQRQAVFPRLLCQNAPDFSFVSKPERHQKGGLRTRISLALV